MADPNFSYAEKSDMNVNNKPPPLTDEEREHLKQELQKTESEIATLRIVLNTRIKEANDLKRRLGLTPWQEFTEDVNQGLNKVKQSEAYHRTNELLQQAGDKVSHTFGQLRQSSLFKSMEDKVGSAYSNVKQKMTPSSSTNFNPQTGTPMASSPATSPMNENKSVPK
uniref:Tumor protein D54 n=1 Tax=Romanomermis culicivorax TaxID=13658 RepID=A0A915KJP9_ROMCU